MKTKIISGLGCAVLLSACASETNDNNEAAANIGSQGMYLHTEIPASADVNGIRFEFTPVSCEDGSPTGDPGITVDRELEPFKIPGGIGELEDNPLDADSEHYFADAFETLDPGCYDVTSTPITDAGEPSEMCLPAMEKTVEVFEGETTEIFLINQCSGTDPGALDAISTLNHEPEGLDVEFEESKFRACGQTQVICATVTDPDKDPIEFEWELDASSPAASGPEVVSREEDPETGTVTECVEYTPSSPGKYNVTVRAYDQLWDGGELKRIEDWLAEQGYPSESHTELRFFFYVSASGASVGGGATLGAAALADAADILILGPTTVAGAGAGEAQVAVSLGYTVDVIDAATWGGYTTGDFASYKAIVLADPRCAYGVANTTTGAVPHLAAAEANVDVWSAAVTGNVVVAGIDEDFHYTYGPTAKATAVTRNLLQFAAAEEGQTGAFVSLSCYYGAIPASAPVPVPALAGFGHFESHGPTASMDNGHIVASHPAMDTLTDDDVSNWSSTVHEVLSTWPSNFEVLAISPDSGSYEAGDGTVGGPFIVARGVIPTSCGNGDLDPSEECDDGNNENGDGCDEACNVEVCGDGVQQAGEACDDGNTESGDGCSRECTIEACF